MHDLGGNYILSFNKPDFIRTTEFTGFKRGSRVAFCTAAFLNLYIFKYCAFRYVPVYAMYFSCKCNVSKILALAVNLKLQMK